MHRVFLTKVWGYDPVTYPALGFNTDGARSKFLRESSPGDWVVLAGTKGKETSPNERGRLLGMVCLGSEEVDVEAVLKSVDAPIPQDHYLEDGTYRWPFGLPMVYARRFVGAPDLKQVLGSYLSGMEWAAYAQDIAEKIAPDAPQKILALPWQEVAIVDAPELVRQRSVQEALQRNRGGGATGPGPSDTRSASNRAPGAAFAYVMQLHGARQTVFKVGYSSDPKKRLAELNRGLITEVTGCSWGLAMQQRFEDERSAYDFEQAMHKRLRRHLVAGENEVYGVAKGELETDWVGVLASGSWAIGAAD